jgi:hypothetical protein
MGRFQQAADQFFEKVMARLIIGRIFAHLPGDAKGSTRVTPREHAGPLF